MEIFNYQDIEAKCAEEGALKLRVRWLITKEVGAENFAMRLFEMEPGGYSPFHSHPWNMRSSFWKVRDLWLVRDRKESLETAISYSSLRMKSINLETMAKEP